jgi:hypothetical protein
MLFSYWNGDLKIVLGRFKSQKSFPMYSRLKTLKKHRLSVNKSFSTQNIYKINLKI